MTARDPHSFPEPDSLSLPLLEDAAAHEAHHPAGSADADVKPSWRGLIHAATFPITIIAGIVLITVVAWVVYDQTIDWAAALGMGLIIAGVVVLNVVSKSAAP